MTENTAQSVHNLGYHAHIYYDPTSTRAVAEGVCAALGEHCQVEIEAFRDTPIGPHPIANVLVIFTPDQFAHVVPYLKVHRDGLEVLVHPLTEDFLKAFNNLGLLTHPACSFHAASRNGEAPAPVVVYVVPKNE